MIIGPLETIDRSISFSERLAASIQFLRTTDLGALKTGKHVIDGELVYALVDEYLTKSTAGAFLEGHRQYIDVLYMIRGCELFGYAPLRAQRFTQPYDPKGDIAFFEGTPSFILLEEGMCAICYPEDLHMPRIAAGSPASVRKILLKVKR